jgi:hypothetical protein
MIDVGRPEPVRQDRSAHHGRQRCCGPDTVLLGFWHVITGTLGYTNIGPQSLNLVSCPASFISVTSTVRLYA